MKKLAKIFAGSQAAWKYINFFFMRREFFWRRLKALMKAAKKLYYILFNKTIYFLGSGLV